MQQFPTFTDFVGRKKLKIVGICQFHVFLSDRKSTFTVSNTYPKECSFYEVKTVKLILNFGIWNPETDFVWIWINQFQNSHVLTFLSHFGQLLSGTPGKPEITIQKLPLDFIVGPQTHARKWPIFEPFSDPSPPCVIFPKKHSRFLGNCNLFLVVLAETVARQDICRFYLKMVIFSSDGHHFDPKWWFSRLADTFRSEMTILPSDGHFFRLTDVFGPKNGHFSRLTDTFSPSDGHFDIRPPPCRFFEILPPPVSCFLNF